MGSMELMYRKLAETAESGCYLSLRFINEEMKELSVAANEKRI